MKKLIIIGLIICFFVMPNNNPPQGVVCEKTFCAEYSNAVILPTPIIYHNTVIRTMTEYVIEHPSVYTIYTKVQNGDIWMIIPCQVDQTTFEQYEVGEYFPYSEYVAKQMSPIQITQIE